MPSRRCDQCGGEIRPPVQVSLLYPVGWDRQGLRTFCSWRCLVAFSRNPPFSPVVGASHTDLRVEAGG